MAVSIGPRPEPSDSLLALLLACHGRIRSFAALALRVGSEPELGAPEVVAAVESVARYFEQALPLHVRDEEESLWPRLRGRNLELDRALQVMHDEHLDHRGPLEELAAALAAVAARPEDPRARTGLREVARALVAAFESHLLAEERTIFPAMVQLLTLAEQQQVVLELRQRRA